MAGVLQHLRSSALNKRPNPASMVDGQIAINYASGAPGMFFKDSNGSLAKVGPVHVGSGAPNAVPASGGTAGNSIGEQWLDTSGGTYVLKIWDGAAWRSEAGEFVNATGDTMTGDLVMNNANVVFEGSVDDGFETTLTVVNPTAGRTITLPNVTGTVVTTGDSGTITSTMIADGTIVNADVNASAAIAGTKISPNFGSQTVQTTGVFTAASGSASAPAIAFTAYTNTGIYSPGADQVAISTNGVQRMNIEADGDINIDSGGVFYDATNNRLAIGTASPATTLDVNGDVTITDKIIHGGDTNTAIRFPAADTVSVETDGNERARIDSSGRLLVGTSSAVNNADLQVANSISVGGTIKREVSKRLNLADNTSTTLFTFQIPGGSSQSHRTYVGGEISYIVAVGRETSSRNSRTTYGKVYFSIDRFWESNANNPVSVNLIDTDKSLSTSNGSAPTITWAITTDAGIDNAAKNVYLAITVDNPFTNTIQTNITGTISYHTLSFSDVTLS
jgi:hypothetical protein